jgi:integrase
MNVKRKQTARINFTVKELDKLEPSADRRLSYYDTETAGLGILIQPKRKGKPAHKMFFWFRRVNGAGKWKKIHLFSDSYSLAQARAIASDYNGKLGYGEQPFEPDRGALTLEKVFDDYIERHLTVEAKNPDRAVKNARWQFDKYLGNSWKGRKLNAIASSDIEKLRNEIVQRGAKAGPSREAGERGRTSANRVLGLIRTLFKWAIKKLSWKGNVPTDGMFYPKGKPRARFIQPDEVPRFFKALRSEKKPDLRDFVYLALFTGARRGDIVAMRWEQLSKTVDGKRQWIIPNPKNQVAYTVPLMPQAVTVLNQRRKFATGDWVFPSHGKTGHVKDFKKAWKKLLTRAKVTNLRIHDLRRTLGSWMAGVGVSLPVIGGALGHQSVEATKVYAKLHVDPIRDAMNAGTRAMLGAAKMNGRKLLEARNG